jgi:flagellar protein FliS
MTRNGISAYRSSLKTVSPLDSVVLLYDGALARIARAVVAVRQGDTVAQLDQVIRAVQILNGLNQSLDMAAGGRVAISLRDMYGAVAVALYNSVGHADAVTASERIAGALRRTRNAWAEIAGIPPLPPESASPTTASTDLEPSTIVHREQELLRHRTSKKSAHATDPIGRPAVPDPSGPATRARADQPGDPAGPHRSIRRRSGSLA